MAKKDYDKVQKREKAKTIVKWVFALGGWTILLGCFIGVLVLGVKGCAKSNKTAEVQAVTTTPLKTKGISTGEMADYYNYKLNKKTGSDYTANHRVLPTFQSGSDNGTLYGYGGFITLYTLGQESESVGFDYVKISYNQLYGLLEGTSNTYYTYGNVFVDFLNAQQESVYVLNVNYTNNQRRESDPSDLTSWEFEYTGSISQGDVISCNVSYNSLGANNPFKSFLSWGFGDYAPFNNVLYRASLNSDVELLTNRPYFQSIAVGSYYNYIIGSIPPDGYNTWYQFFNGWTGYIPPTSEPDDYFPSGISYEVYRGYCDYGNGVHYCDISFIYDVAKVNEGNQINGGIGVYLRYVRLYDYTLNDYLYLYELTSYDKVFGSRSIQQLTELEYDYNSVVIDFYSFEPTNAKFYTYYYGTNLGDQYVRPYLYDGNNNATLSYEAFTKLVFNNDRFTHADNGSEGSTESSGGIQAITGVFGLLTQAFTAISAILNITILPGISVGTLIFLPLVITIVLFIIWLIKR